MTVNNKIILAISIMFISCSGTKKILDAEPQIDTNDLVEEFERDIELGKYNPLKE